MKVPKTKQNKKSNSKTSNIQVYYITVVHDWLSTGSSSVSLKKKITYPAQLIQSNLVMKEPSV